MYDICSQRHDEDVIFEYISVCPRKKVDEVKDKIFDLPSTLDIKADGEEINPDHVFVIKSYESYYESKGLASLLVNSSMKI